MVASPQRRLTRGSRPLPKVAVTQSARHGRVVPRRSSGPEISIMRRKSPIGSNVRQASGVSRGPATREAARATCAAASPRYMVRPGAGRSFRERDGGRRRVCGCGGVERDVPPGYAGLWAALAGTPLASMASRSASWNTSGLSSLDTFPASKDLAELLGLAEGVRRALPAGAASAPAPWPEDPGSVGAGSARAVAARGGDWRGRSGQASL